MTDLICPNCGASASLPFEMTCDDHRPGTVCDICANQDEGTIHD